MPRTIAYRAGGFTNCGIGYTKFSQEELIERRYRAMTEIEKTIEQLERVSKNLGCIGEDEDCTETAILALEEVQKYRALEKRLADMFGGSLTLEIVMDELEQQ